MAPFEVRVLRAGSIRSERPVAQHPLWRPDNRIQIEEVYPELDGGRYPVKRIVGELFEVWADLFRDGHDKLRAVVKYRHEDEAWRETPFVFYDNDRWVGRFRLDAVGLWRYTIEAWTDQFESWRDEVEKKLRGRPEPRTRTRRGAGDRGSRAGSRRSWRWGLYPEDVARIRRSTTAPAAPSCFSRPKFATQWRAVRCAPMQCVIRTNWRSSSTARRQALPRGMKCSRAAKGWSPAKAPRLMIASRACPKSRGSASTSSISCRSIRSAASTARVETTAPLRSRVTQAALTPSVRKKAVTGQSTPSWARLPISAVCPCRRGARDGGGTGFRNPGRA